MSGKPSDDAANTPAATDWSAVSDGLRIRLELQPSVSLAPPANGLQQVPATLYFENTTAAPLRILVIGPEPFRLFNSTLRVWEAGKVVSLQPEPHPHGYLITEEDFPVIPAHATHTVVQNLTIEPAMAHAGSFEVEWMYENKSRKFPGGAQTLDGVTKPLFGGAEVPDLWVGELAARRTVQLALP